MFFFVSTWNTFLFNGLSKINKSVENNFPQNVVHVMHFREITRALKTLQNIGDSETGKQEEAEKGQTWCNKILFYDIIITNTTDTETEMTTLILRRSK